MLWKNRWISFKLAESFPSVYFLFEALNLKMYEIQWTISASGETGIYKVNSTPAVSGYIGI